MIYYSKRAIRFFWIFFLTAIFIFGFLTASLRLLLPQVSSYHSEIEAWCSQKIGQSVKIGKVQAEMRGFFPELSLSKIRIISKETKSPLIIEHAFVTFSLLEYLKTQQLILDKIALTGLTITIKRLKNQQYRIAGINLNSSEKGTLQHQIIPYTIKVKNAKIRLEDDILGIKKQLNEVTFLLKRKGLYYQLASEFKLLEASPNSIHFMSNLTFSKQNKMSFKGKTYFSTKTFDLHQLLLGTAFSSDLEATTDLSLWTFWENSQMVNMIAKVDATKIKIQDNLVPINQISLVFNAKKNPQQWVMKSKIKSLIIDQQNIPINELTAQYRTKNQQQQFLFKLDTLDFAIASHLPVLQRFNSKQIQTKGWLKSTQLLVLKEKEKPLWWQLQSIFSNLELAQSGISERGLSGKIKLQSDFASIDLDIEKGILDWQSVFNQPLRIDSLIGRLYWQKTKQGWFLDTPELTLKTPDFDTNHRFRFIYSEKAKSYLDWQGDFKAVKGENAPLYYPKQTPKSVLKWLTKSIPTVQFPTGSGLFRGYLADYPFKNNTNGHFSLDFDMKEGLLHYYPQFPPIKNVAGHLHFSKNKLLIQKASGQIYNSPLHHIEGVLPDITKSPYIRFNGLIKGNLTDYKRFLVDTPLKDRFADALSILEIKGRSNLQLNLNIPLRGADLSFNGGLKLHHNRLNIPTRDIQLKQINGVLNISDQGIKGHNIQAKFRNYAITVDAKTTNKGVLVEANATLGLKGLIKKENAFLLDYIKGQSAFHLALQLPPFGQKQGAILSLNSNLIGIKSTLPTPFDKRDYEHKNFSLSLPLQGGVAALKYADIASIIASYHVKNGLGATNICFTKKAKLPKKKELLIDGKLRQLKIDEWLSLFNHFPKKTSSFELPPLVTDFSIGQLKYKNKDYGMYHVNLTNKKALYSADIKGSILDGKIIYNQKKSIFKADLKRLSLDYEYTEEKETIKSTPFDPRILPEFDIKIDKLFVNSFLLGKLTLNAKKKYNGLLLKQLKIKGYKLNVDATGAFYQNARKSPKIEFKAKIKSPNMGNLVNIVTKKPPVKKGKLDLTVDLTWPTKKSILDVVAGYGKMRLDISKGQFNDIDSGNAGRLINMLNLGGLIRKVQLDLDTVKEKTFSFEKLEGDLSLYQGDILTKNLKMESNTADILVKGEIQLVSEKIDLVLKVTPHLSSTLPLAATLAGGPVAGVAALIAQKAIGKQVDKITELTYTAKGTWEDVELKSELVEELKKRANDQFQNAKDQLKQLHLSNPNF